MKNSKKFLVKAYSLTELLIVLCIIGILIYIAVPDQTSTISRAKSIEAQNMLNMVYGLEKTYFYRHARYSADLEEIGFEQTPTMENGGSAIYEISVIEASSSSFKAQAVSIQDLNGDGKYNTWEINENKKLKEVIKD